MSTVLIVVIVVVVVIALLLLVLAPRMRERGRVAKRERELDQRRDTVATEHREEAAGRERQAEVAEQRARVAEQEAQRERAEAQLQKEKATLHEKGLADHELVADDEREKFAGTSAMEPESGGEHDLGRDPSSTGAQRDRGIGRSSGDDESLERKRTSAFDEGRAAADDPNRAADFRDGLNREERT